MSSVVKWYGERVIKEMEKRHNLFLHGAGHLGVNTCAQMVHVDTGALKNSISFRLTDGGGGGTSDLIKSNDPDYVKIGSNLVYANAQERHNGWASRSLDLLTRSGIIMKLAKQVFKIG